MPSSQHWCVAAWKMCRLSPNPQHCGPDEPDEFPELDPPPPDDDFPESIARLATGGRSASFAGLPHSASRSKPLRM